jgi:hypothetical protein
MGVGRTQERSEQSAIRSKQFTVPSVHFAQKKGAANAAP